MQPIASHRYIGGMAVSLFLIYTVHMAGRLSIVRTAVARGLLLCESCLYLACSMLVGYSPNLRRNAAFVFGDVAELQHLTIAAPRWRPWRDGIRCSPSVRARADGRSAAVWNTAWAECGSMVVAVFLT